MTTIREVKESELPQGVDEIIAYTVDTTPWGGYTSGVAVILKDSDGDDVSSDNLSGAPSEAADVITTPLVYGLTAGENYRLEILWVYSGNTFETFLTLMAED